MGSCNFKTDIHEPALATSKTDFQLHFVIGKGGFGKVWKLEHKQTGELFAMKEMSKARVLSKKSVSSVMSERRLLAQLRHPFIVNIHYAFQDRENLYLIMDLMPGGDLRYHLGKLKRFSEEQTSLEYLHSCGVLHRDIKPENLVLDGRGYVHITDFGVARVWQAENAKDTSGTPGYMAPEVLSRQNHGLAVDYFALGVIAYECTSGKRPYSGKNKRDIREQVLASQAQLQEKDLPLGWSVQSLDFINRLLQRKPSNRLGYRGSEEVRHHPWYVDFPWEKLKNKEIVSPLIPSQEEDHFDPRLNSSNDPWKDSHSSVMREAALQLKKEHAQEMFAGYDYDPSAHKAIVHTVTNV